MDKYEKYCSNLDTLRRAPEQDLTDEFVQSGILKMFVMQFELAWRLLRKIFKYDGSFNNTANSPRGIIKTAHFTYDFIDEDLWLAMLNDRNIAERAHESNLVECLIDNILMCYIAAFEGLLSNLEKTYRADLLETF